MLGGGISLESGGGRDFGCVCVCERGGESSDDLPMWSSFKDFASPFLPVSELPDTLEALGRRVASSEGS